MNLNYHIFNGMPEGVLLNGILQLHVAIFGSSDHVISKMANKPKLLVITAMDDNKIVGYKMGYALSSNKFYSWLGGVDGNYRNHGIAKKLMEKQHQYLKENGYNVVQTKTMNKWRSMLILNIKSGFNIMDTYTDEKGLHKIILEKSLN